MSAPVDTAPGCGRVRVPSPASPPLSRRSPGDPPGLRARLARALPAGSLRRRLAGGALWSTVGAAAAQGLGLVAQALAARALGASGYGGLAVVLATVALLSELVTAGVGLTATRFVAEHRERDPARAGRILGLGAAVALAAGVALAAALALAAPLIARVALGTPELAPALRLAAPMVLFASVTGAQAGALQGLEEFRLLAAAGAARGIGTCLLVPAGAALLGVTGGAVGSSAAAGLGALAHELVLRRACARRGVALARPAREDLALLWRFSLPALVAGISFTPAAWWSGALLARRSLAESGVFAAARQWQFVVMFLAAAVANLGLPLLASSLPGRDFRAWSRALGASLAATTGLALATAVPVALASPLLVSLYGPEFQGHAFVLVLVALSAVLMAANLAVGHALWSLGAARAAMLLALVRGAALVALSHLLVGRGAEGIALAWVGTGLVQTAAQVPFTLWLVRRVRAAWARPPAAAAGEAAGA